MTPDQTAEALVAIRAASDRWARPSELGPLEISITPPRGDVDTNSRAGMPTLVSTA